MLQVFLEQMYVNVLTKQRGRGGEGKDRLKPDPPSSSQQQDGLVLSPQGRSFLTGCQGHNSSDGILADNPLNLLRLLLE